MGKPWNGSVRGILVEDMEQGTLIKHTTQETVQEAFFDNIHWRSFFLPEAVPACNGPLQGLFGYNAVTITLQQILNGSYPYPPDFDQARIRMMIPKDSLNMVIFKTNWKQQWKGCREFTSSLESGLHFGHYIAGCDSDHISYFLTLKGTLISSKEVSC